MPVVGLCRVQCFGPHFRLWIGPAIKTKNFNRTDHVRKHRFTPVVYLVSRHRHLLRIARHLDPEQKVAGIPATINAGLRILKV